MLQNDRFEQLSLNIKYLVDKENSGLDSFGKMFGLNRGAISSYIRGKATPKLETLQKISDFYQLSLDYLVNSKLSEVDKNELPKTHKIMENKGVPYYDIDVAASFEHGFKNMDDKPEFFVDFLPFNDCSAYLPVYGESMYPVFTSGEIIAVKRVDNHNIILWGEAYLVVTNSEANNLRTVKLLFQHTDDDKVILRAANPEFKGDTIISKSCITDLYIVKGKITRKQL